MTLRPFVVFLAACAGGGSAATVDAPIGGDASSPPRDAAVTADAPADGHVGDGCTADSECASGACHEATGTCVPEAEVLFVATTGDDGGTCTRTEPCLTVARAAALLSQSRDTIAIAAGTYAGVFGIAVPALVSGPSRDASQVFLTSTDANSIIVRLESAAIAVEGVSIGGNTTTSAPQAVTIGSSATITYDHVIVRNNAGTGTFVDASSLTVRDYEAYANEYAILASETSTIDVDRTYVHDNTFSALAAANQYRIVNTMIAHNGIGFIPFNDNTGTLEFSTFAAQTDTVISSTHAITVGDSIFYNNAIVASDPVEHGYCLFSGAAPAGTGNLTGDPAFVNAGANDYHLSAGSPAIDRADPAANLGTDFDGDSRPKGAGWDIGADER